MHPNELTLKKFYDAFAQLDAVGMAECYADDATFDDEAFSLLGKREVCAMWAMLCEATRAKGRDVWKLQSSGIAADARQGRAHWEADYRFSATGRLVHNIIDGRFRAWSRQALGAPGLLLGWTPFLRAKVRARAAGNLARFMADKP